MPGAPLPEQPPVRLRPVWRLLTSAVAAVADDDAPVRVLDCGGGTGTFAVPLAQRGAQVTVVDASADALAILRRRAGDAQVGGRVTAMQGDIETLGEQVPAASFDLVLAHGVLEAVTDPVSALRAVASAARPGGLVSVLVANPAASVLARALAGDLTAALAELRGTEAPVAQRVDPAGVIAALGDLGFAVESISGVGIFAELVPGVDADAGGDVLDRLEDLAATRSPYREIAGRLHVLARRPPEPID